jgi:predicted DNA-binding transcriptional regulator AlpA
MCTAVRLNQLNDEEYNSIKLLDKRVVASVLGVSVRTVEGWANGRPGGPACLRIGRRVKWLLSSIQRYIKARLQKEIVIRGAQRRRRCKRK